MNKNFIFLAIVLSVTVNEAFTGGRRPRTKHRAVPVYNAADSLQAQRIAQRNEERDQRAARRESAKKQRELAEVAATQQESNVQVMCGICQDPDDQTCLLIEPEALAMLSCTHHDFHQACLEAWLTPEHNTCPLCRAPGRIKQAQTFFLDAVDSGDLVRVQTLLTEPGIDINATRQHGYTALHSAVIQGSLEIVQALLVLGININAATQGGITALHIAAQNGFLEIVQALLNAPGINVNVASEVGFSALHWAAEVDNTEIIQALLEHGASTSLLDINNRTPADLACTPEIRQLILSYRAQ